MNKPYFVHLQNKYPRPNKVVPSEGSILVYSDEGELLCAVARDGNGQWSDQQKELGARDKFDLAPIPKHARVKKLFPDGRVGDSEEASARRENADEYAGAYNGRVPSLHELAGGDAQGAEVCKSSSFLEQFADGEDPVLPKKAGGGKAGGDPKTDPKT